jgi:drug/metabolite transporter (DMT)-like permease
MLVNFRGEVAALGAAFLWAIASVVYARLGEKILPLVLNLSKVIIAIVYIGLTLVIRQDLFSIGLDGRAIAMLGLSGILGIGIGDTLYFESLNCLGARRALVLQTLSPPLTALVASLFLQEYLSLQSWLGILLTVLGVTWVTSERTPEWAGREIQLQRGFVLSLLSVVMQSGGVLLSRWVLTTTTIDPLLSTLIRLIAGMASLLLWFPLWHDLAQNQVLLRSRQLWGVIALTAFFSTYLGIWLQQLSLKFAAAGIAQALSATSPLFVLPLALWMGEILSLRGTLGVVVALAGVWLLLVRL